MLTRRAKAYSSFCSQIALVYLQTFRRIHSLSARHSRRLQKVIDVHTTKKLVTNACCDRQHIHAYLQPFSR